MLDNLVSSMKYVLTGMGLLRINLENPKNRVSYSKLTKIIRHGIYCLGKIVMSNNSIVMRKNVLLKNYIVLKKKNCIILKKKWNVEELHNLEKKIWNVEELHYLEKKNGMLKNCIIFRNMECQRELHCLEKNGISKNCIVLRNIECQRITLS